MNVRRFISNELMTFAIASVCWAVNPSTFPVLFRNSINDGSWRLSVNAIRTRSYQCLMNCASMPSVFIWLNSSSRDCLKATSFKTSGLVSGKWYTVLRMWTSTSTSANMWGKCLIDQCTRSLILASLIAFLYANSLIDRRHLMPSNSGPLPVVYKIMYRSRIDGVTANTTSYSICTSAGIGVPSIWTGFPSTSFKYTFMYQER